MAVKQFMCSRSIEALRLMFDPSLIPKFTPGHMILIRAISTQDRSLIDMRELLAERLKPFEMPK